MSMVSSPPPPPKAWSRRRFLARNCLAVGAIVSTALVVKARRAQAAPPPAQTCFSFPPFIICFGNGNGGNCFLEGTRVATVAGERKIEDLAVGDLLPTVFGGAQPIQWIAHHRLKKADPKKPWDRDARPVRIARSAIGPNAPHADLYVTYGHALLIDGVLIPAGNLINGTTIRYADSDDRDELAYFHVKLEGHDAVYAEGLPCETLDHVSETANDYAEYVRLHGAPAPLESCAPRLSFEGGRGEIASRLRSFASPWRDIRRPNDLIRDRLEERALDLVA